MLHEYVFAFYLKCQNEMAFRVLGCGYGWFGLQCDGFTYVDRMLRLLLSERKGSATRWFQFACNRQMNPKRKANIKTKHHQSDRHLDPSDKVVSNWQPETLLWDFDVLRPDLSRVCVCLTEADWINTDIFGCHCHQYWHKSRVLNFNFIFDLNWIVLYLLVQA